jgi:hypothetical protein
MVSIDTIVNCDYADVGISPSKHKNAAHQHIAKSAASSIHFYPSQIPLPSPTPAATNQAGGHIGPPLQNPGRVITKPYY